MTIAEIIENSAVQGNFGEGTVIFRALTSGKIKSADVQAYYREKHYSELEAKIQGWFRGILFAAQKMDFIQWLNVGENSIKEDLRRAKDCRNAFFLCGETVPEIEAFISCRIETPGIEARRRIADSKDYSQYQSLWIAAQRRNKWEWE